MRLNLPLQLNLKTLARLSSRSKDPISSERIEKYDNLPWIRFITDNYGFNKEDNTQSVDRSDIQNNLSRTQSMLTKLKERNNQLMQQELKYLKRNMLKPKIEGMKTKNAGKKFLKNL